MNPMNTMNTSAFPSAGRAYRLLSACFSLGLAGLLGAPAAWAATLQVTVLDREGQPAPNVAVVIVPAGPAAAPVPAAPATAVVVAQEKMQFQPFLTVVAPGTTLRFTNRDSFDHHVKGNALSGPFELRVDARPAASTAPTEIRVVQPGPVTLSCHLHSTMRGGVYVSETPWFGKTDARGQVLIDGIPAGTAAVRLWHPEQFVEQMPASVVLAANGLQTVETRLNFMPRKRRTATP